MTDATVKKYRVCLPSAPMKAAPHQDAECTNECLYGERVQCVSTALSKAHVTQAANELASNSSTKEHPAQWLHVSADRDGYSGYMHTTDLQAITGNTPAATHWVSARTTLVFNQASIKSPVVCRLPFLSCVTSQAVVDGGFRQLCSGDFIWDQHLLSTGKCIDLTAIELAKSHFMGAPYLWGGCSPNGLDCSGLVQALATAKGIHIPRDSGDQEQALTNTIAVGQQRSQDLVYWPGHTGILLDADTLLHATAHSLSCVVEPLQDVVQRAGEISSIKRLFD